MRELREWNEYYMNVLGRMENGKRFRERVGRGRVKRREEVERVLNLVKDGKATREEEIPNEI